MIEIELDKAVGVVKVKPISPLEKKDFIKISKEIDPYIKEMGGLKGLIIYCEHFPRWKNMNAISSHIKFVKNHHKKIRKIAAVTDSTALSRVFKLVQPFLKPEIKYYRFNNGDDANMWIHS